MLMFITDLSVTEYAMHLGLFGRYAIVAIELLQECLLHNARNYMQIHSQLTPEQTKINMHQTPPFCKSVKIYTDLSCINNVGNIVGDNPTM